jgi:hypothetical protein
MMGAWGSGSFDNDTACDWAYEIEGAEDLSPVEETIAGVLAAGSDYLDTDDACRALAACEVVARLKGNWGKRDAYSKGVDQWVQDHPALPPAELVRDALRAIDRILQPPSELLELWDEGGTNGEWHAAVDDLRTRVGS